MNTSKFDVVIIGGGLAGLSLASFQASLDKKIAVIEKGTLDKQPTSLAATGVFMHRGSTQFFSDFRRLQIKAVEYYPQWLKKLNQTLATPIQCKQTGQYHFFDFNLEEGKRYFNNEIRKLTREKSLDFKILDDLPLKQHLQHQNMQCISYPKESFIDIHLLLKGLKQFCLNQDVSFFENATIQEIIPDIVQLQFKHQENFKEITCERLVIAAGAHSHYLLQNLGYTSFISAVKGMSFLIPRFYTENTFLHYNRGLCIVPRGKNLLVGSTSENSWNINDSPEHFQNLKNYLSQFVQIENPIQPLQHWNGLRPKVKDRMPMIGFLDENKRLAILTGHYKCGVGMIPYSALCLSQMLSNQTPDFDMSAFDPKREIKHKKVH